MCCEINIASKDFAVAFAKSRSTLSMLVNGKGLFNCVMISVAVPVKG